MQLLYLQVMYGILFDPYSSMSQYQQLVNQLRSQITHGKIPGGSKLVSSRELSRRLHIARGIVIEAFDQLKMEGYLEGRQGSGTYVRKNLVWESFEPAPSVGNSGKPLSSSSRDSEIGARPLSFVPGMPDMNLFPRRRWLSCYRDAVEYAEIRDLEYAPPNGRWDLRQAIAKHLTKVKGILAEPENILVTAGSSQGFTLLVRMFDHPRIALEDPQAEFVYRIFREQSDSLSLIPVDDQGIMAQKIPEDPLDLIYVTPTHQFPLGGTLSAERRTDLLKKAQASGAWIIEDDFDSEFRYQGKPVAPLQVMAPERVIYVGTFSKVVSPALRIGFMVLPPAIQSRVKELKKRWDFWNEGLQQKAMALFIDRGHLERHIAKAHRSYEKKNLYLKELIKNRLPAEWKIQGATSGMHLALYRFDERGRPLSIFPILKELRNRGFLVDSAHSYSRQEKKVYENVMLLAFGKRDREELQNLIQNIASLESV